MVHTFVFICRFYIAPRHHLGAPNFREDAQIKNEYQGPLKTIAQSLIRTHMEQSSPPKLASPSRHYPSGTALPSP